MVFASGISDIVSIRALARRATSKSSRFWGAGSFNSCPRAEGNARPPNLSHRCMCFNSCPRAEGNRYRM